MVRLIKSPLCGFEPAPDSQPKGEVQCTMPVQSFHTDDVDEANAIYNQVFYEHRHDLVPGSRNPYRFSAKIDTVGPLTVGIMNHGSEIVARTGGLDMTYTVAVALTGVFSAQFGHEDLTADRYTAVVTTPTSHLSYRGYRTGAERLLSMTFNQDTLEAHLSSLLGREPAGQITFAPILDLRQERASQWWQLARTVVLALQSPDGLSIHPMLSASLSSSIMTGLLLAADHPYREALDAWTQPLPPTSVRRAIAYIEEHAHEPLTVVDVCVALTCGVRGLQSSFKKHLNITPVAYIKRVRMDRAHSMLRFANPRTTTVAEIARTWGFTQPGRFATEYREIYGVSPSVTLRES